MGQPAWTIAEAIGEALAKPQENSLQSTTTIDASPVVRRGEAIKSIPTRGDDGVDDLIWHAPSGRLQSSPVVPELSPIAPPATPRIAPMAPGVGGFNIDLPAPRASRVDEVAIEDLRDRPLLKPKLVPQPPIQAEPKPIIAPTDESSFVLKLFAIIAIVGVAGTMLLAVRDEPRKQVSDIPSALTTLHEVPSAGRSAQPTHLAVEGTKGFANEPLPLGISIKNALGGETVTVTGLAEGTELSLGTSIGPTGWLVSARDLDKAFVAAPEDFVGIMDATVNLRSTSDQLLDSQAVRFEWIEKKQEGLMPALKPEPTPVLPPLDPEQIATLIKLGQDLLKHGDIMSAQLLLKRAAIAGDAQAALELGLTYDRVFLAQSGVLGFAPDVGQAREWYDKAIKLGSTEAAQHLERLSSMPK